MSVEILVNDKPVKKYSHKGKVFIEAKEGAEYSIKFKNDYYSKILAIFSVDGINVLNGEAAGSSKEGYVINGYSSYNVKGFRTSNESVNAFKFSKKEVSYASKSEETQGDTSNCGVIGVRVFFEKVPDFNFFNGVYVPRLWQNPVIIGGSITNDGSYGSGATLSFGGQLTTSCLNINNSMEVARSVSSDADFDLGTEFSKKEIKDKVHETEFEPGSLAVTHEIYYASRNSLIAMGVDVDKKIYVSAPSAFPQKFCKPPKD